MVVLKPVQAMSIGPQTPGLCFRMRSSNPIRCGPDRYRTMRGSWHIPYPRLGLPHLARIADARNHRGFVHQTG
jgi:hypothetical protein